MTQNLSPDNMLQCLSKTADAHGVRCSQILGGQDGCAVNATLVPIVSDTRYSVEASVQISTQTAGPCRELRCDDMTCRSRRIMIAPGLHSLDLHLSLPRLRVDERLSLLRRRPSHSPG